MDIVSNGSMPAKKRREINENCSISQQLHISVNWMCVVFSGVSSDNRNSGIFN